jgi:hypothetical protein
MPVIVVDASRLLQRSAIRSPPSPGLECDRKKASHFIAVDIIMKVCKRPWFRTDSSQCHQDAVSSLLLTTAHKFTVAISSLPLVDDIAVAHSRFGIAISGVFKRGLHCCLAEPVAPGMPSLLLLLRGYSFAAL